MTTDFRRSQRGSREAELSLRNGIPFINEVTIASNLLQRLDFLLAIRPIHPCLNIGLHLGCAICIDDVEHPSLRKMTPKRLLLPTIKTVVPRQK